MDAPQDRSSAEKLHLKPYGSSSPALTEGTGSPAAPGPGPSLPVVKPMVGPSTFSTLPGVTAANINSKVTCVEPAY